MRLYRSPLTFAPFGAVLTCAVLIGGVACGGDGTIPPSPDASVAVRGDLVIVSAETIGLGFGQRAELEVRYTVFGAPVAGRIVNFALATDFPNESAGGATLSTSLAPTDADGRAHVAVVAGAAAASFRVLAQAADARPVTFNVSVTDEGFADLLVTPKYSGGQELGTVHAIEVRMYRARSCTGLAPETAPPSTDPPRSLSQFDQTATFVALPASVRYALLSWAVDSDGRVLADTCIDLAARQLRAGVAVRIDLPVTARPLALPTAVHLTSTFDLRPVRQLLLGAAPGWATATCPLGAAQLLLDCAIDELDGGDADDCVVSAPGPIARALAAARGPLDAEGCRGGTLDGSDTLDLQVERALGAAAGALPMARATLVDLLRSVRTESHLAQPGPWTIHRMETISLEAAGERYPLALIPTLRPIVIAPLTVGRTGVAVALGRHGYTLRIGQLLRTAFTEETGHSNPDRLGTELIDSVGCATLDPLICAAARLEPDCFVAACKAARQPLDDLLAAPFARLDTLDLDFELQVGSALLLDENHDGIAEQLSEGQWRARLSVQGVNPVEISGVFLGE